MNNRVHPQIAIHEYAAAVRHEKGAGMNPSGTGELDEGRGSLRNDEVPSMHARVVRLVLASGYTKIFPS